MQNVEPFEIQIPAIHDVDGPGFGEQQVEHVDVMPFAIGNVNKAGNRAAQIE